MIHYCVDGILDVWILCVTFAALDTWTNAHRKWATFQWKSLENAFSMNTLWVIAPKSMQSSFFVRVCIIVESWMEINWLWVFGLNSACFSMWVWYIHIFYLVESQWTFPWKYCFYIVIHIWMVRNETPELTFIRCASVHVLTTDMILS